MKKNKELFEYLGLKLNKIPDSILNKDNIDIKTSEIFNQKNYKVYRYLSIKEINIVLTDTRRLDEPSKKIESMNDLSFYLNKKNEEEYNMFLKLIDEASIESIEEIESIQKAFKSKPSSKIKYNKDYIWQIYYIERTNKYYMIVPLQETETQCLFYVLKKKLEESNDKIYVPICNSECSNKILDKSKISALENNLHSLTNEWPHIYEVYDIDEELSLNIIGEIDVYENIRSDYKMKYLNFEELKGFYKLLQKLVYIQTELPNFYKFDIQINSKGEMSLWYNGLQLTYEKLDEFYEVEIKHNLKNIEDIEKIKKSLEKKANVLKIEEKKLNIELSSKQKQISTFLECRKSFFGRVKYFFKHNKKKNIEDTFEIVDEKIENEEDNVKTSYSNDIDDLIYICKNLKKKTTESITARLDIKNLDIKIDILKKKIENATKFIEEIESHKKSIFEFWKFTNKDEKNQLSEGITQIEHESKIEKNFSINEDLNEVCKNFDLNQRNNLTEEEQNAVYVSFCIEPSNIAKTDADLNSFIDNNISTEGKSLTHREKPKTLKNVLKFKNELSKKENSLKLKEVYKNLNNAFKKSYLDFNIPVFSLAKPEKSIMIFEMNPQKFDLSNKKIEIYKVNLKAGTNILALSNIILFDNRNDTLPVGMDYYTKVLVDLRKKDILEVNQKSNYTIKLLDNSTKMKATKIDIIEYNI